MNKFIILIATGLYFVFANWFICSKVGHVCSSCMDAPSIVIVNPDVEGIKEFNLVPNVIDFSMNSAFPDTGYFFHVFLNHIESVVDHKTLVIIGEYFDTEENGTPYENLGVARADEVKQLLLSKGIAEKDIEIASEKKSNVDNLDELPNPSFQIKWIDKILVTSNSERNDQSSLENQKNPEIIEKDSSITYTNNELSDNLEIQVKKKTEEKSKEKVSDSKVEKLSNKVVIYFPFNSTKIKNYKDLDAYLSELADRMKSNKKLKVMLTGHTDSKGSVFANNRVAHRRAKIIRDILHEKGVSRKQIATESRGSTDPMVANTSKKNRQKNRRVEVFVIE